MTCCPSLLVFCCGLLYAISCLPEDEASAPLRVVSVTPLGPDVSTSLRQITIEFNKPMLALGGFLQEFEEVPIEIAPSVRGIRLMQTNSGVIATMILKRRRLIRLELCKLPSRWTDQSLVRVPNALSTQHNCPSNRAGLFGEVPLNRFSDFGFLDPAH